MSRARVKILIRTSKPKTIYFQEGGEAMGEKERLNFVVDKDVKVKFEKLADAKDCQQRNHYYACLRAGYEPGGRKLLPVQSPAGEFAEPERSG